MIYADTSALAKLVVAENETSALREWLARRNGRLVTNAVGVVELHRLAARVGPIAAQAAVAVLNRVDRVALTEAALALAARIPPPQVRTLDALHIASAAELSDLQVLLTYDQRMADAARDFGLPVESPTAAV